MQFSNHIRKVHLFQELQGPDIHKELLQSPKGNTIMDDGEILALQIALLHLKTLSLVLSLHNKDTVDG